MIKRLISSDSKFFYLLDENMQTTHKVDMSSYMAGLDTVIFDPFKGPENFFAGSEKKSSGTAEDPRHFYSFRCVDGIVSEFQDHDINHILSKWSTPQLESFCFNPAGELVLLEDHPQNKLYFCSFVGGVVTLLRSLELGQFGLSSAQSVCYVPWMDAYLVSDNYLDKLMVISESEGIIDEILLNRISVIPTNCQGVAVDYETRNIFLTSYVPEDAVIELTFGGKEVNYYPQSVWETTPAQPYDNPTSIDIFQNPFR